MKVELVSYSIPDLDKIISITGESPSVKDLIRAGAESPLEHIVFTFRISDISRACSHQLVRHRIASYTQESQRYTVYRDDSKERYVTPDSILFSSLYRRYCDLIDRCYDLYRKMIEKKIPVEDARYILPNAWCTSIYMTMNLREIRHFLRLRMKKRSQWEIRELACRIFDIVYRIVPDMLEDLRYLREKEYNRILVPVE